MKKKTYTTLFFVFTLLTFTFLSGCKEDDDLNFSTKTIEGLLYYYTNEATKQIRVIDLNSNSAFRRSYTLSDDNTLEDIALGRDYLVIKVYRPSTTSAIAAAKGKLIKSKVLENNWLFVGNNPFLGLTGTTEDSYNDASEFSNNATGFTFHKIEEINGEDVYAIESVGYPGRYFSHQGHPIQGANLLFLEEYSSPQNAPKFRLYKPKATFLEGATDVPVDAGFAG
jgi:hypothetical protein